MRPKTESAIERLVNTIVDDHLSEGQLDNSGLSLGDIKLLRSSFIETLHGRYHMRIIYPGNVVEPSPDNVENGEQVDEDDQENDVPAEEPRPQRLDEQV